jgi:hypothetical protein
MPLAPLVRLYFASVGLFAAFVAGVGLGLPHLIDHALPWFVPPLHARIIGAVYLGGMVLMFGALRQPVLRVWAMLPLAATWTGALLVVSILWIGSFDFGHWPTRFWWFAYLVFPLAGAWLALRLPAGLMTGPWPPAAIALMLVAAGLLVLPGQAARLWPWPLPPLLSQVYSGPLFGLAVGIALVRRRSLAEEQRLLALGLLTMAGAALIASLLHLSLFSAASPATWVWFGFLVLALTRTGRGLLRNDTA